MVTGLLSRLSNYWVCSLHSYRTYLFYCCCTQKKSLLYVPRVLFRPCPETGSRNWRLQQQQKKLPRICWKFWIKLYIFMRNTAGASDKYFMCSAFNYVSVRTSLDCRWIKEPELYCWFKGHIIFLLAAGQILVVGGEFAGGGVHDYVVARFNADMIFNCCLLFVVCYFLVFAYKCAIAFDLNYVGNRTGLNAVPPFIRLHMEIFVYKIKLFFFNYYFFFVNVVLGFGGLLKWRFSLKQQPQIDTRNKALIKKMSPSNKLFDQKELDDVCSMWDPISHLIVYYQHWQWWSRIEISQNITFSP